MGRYIQATASVATAHGLAELNERLLAALCTDPWAQGHLPSAGEKDLALRLYELHEGQGQTSVLMIPKPSKWRL